MGVLEKSAEYISSSDQVEELMKSMLLVRERTTTLIEGLTTDEVK